MRKIIHLLLCNVFVLGVALGQEESGEIDTDRQSFFCEFDGKKIQFTKIPGNPEKFDPPYPDQIAYFSLKMFEDGETTAWSITLTTGKGEERNEFKKVRIYYNLSITSDFFEHEVESPAYDLSDDIYEHDFKNNKRRFKYKINVEGNRKITLVCEELI